jgi:cell wall-associated NlpC family hydrolase
MIASNSSFFKSVIVSGVSLFLLSSFTDSRKVKIENTGLPKNNIETVLTINHIADPIEEDLRTALLNFGKSLLGTRYIYGGTSKKGFDCSGFVYFVYKNFNINVPRSTSQFKNFGKEIAIDQVKKGDILLFLSPTRNVIGHIGIVSNADGMRSKFIHSSSGKQMQVMISNLSHKSYTRRFVKAIRVLQ